MKKIFFSLIIASLILVLYPLIGLAQTTDSPDLTVSDITYSNDQFYVNYCNQGQGTSDVKFSIKLSSAKCSTCNITIGGDLTNYAVPAAGQCATSEAVGKNWFGIGTDSSVEMTATADYGATVGESDENNNTLVKTVVVSTTITPIETKHFIMTVKWGNVRGDVSDRTQATFDGSISSNDSSTRISLIRELLFENHDSLVSRKSPVSWQSLIYGHWDGVRVLVSAPTTADITIDVGQGSASKTVQELFDLTEPLVVDAGSGKELVIKSHPYKKRRFFMVAFWGDGPLGQKADFAGSLVLAGGSKVKLKKELRFEKNDEVLTDSTTDISWNSIIVGGKDGLFFRVKFDKEVNDSDTLTMNFSALGWSKTYRLIDLYHNRITREVLSNTTILPCLNLSATENNELTACKTTGQATQVSARPYHLVIALKQDQHTNKRLVKSKDSPAVYMIEDGIKKPIISAEVFEDNKLDWNKVETVEQEEVESYAQGDVLNYPDGVLVKGSGPSVYVISGGRKRPIKSAAAFLRLGYKWGHIRTIRDAEVNAYPTDSYVTQSSDHPDGAMIREKGKSGVYVIKGGKKRPVRSADIFNSRAYKWDRVLDVEKKFLDKFQDGDAETYPDGTLVQGEGQGGVYIIDKGKKRAFKSAKDFLSMNKKWSNIKKIKATELNALSTGEDMIGQ